ncbi:MAG: ROK family protein [Clostridiaceae bacterium]|nr:ROK family protein [Clostridiaceae bacterium]
MKYFVGIDLGGTNIKAGIVDEQGKIICKDRMKTNAARDQLAIVRDMALMAEKVIKQAGKNVSEIEAIGIGSPGTPDNDTGYLIYANNLPFRNLPMRKEIRKHLDLPVFIDNDANVAALAESVAGGAHGAGNAVAITLGTGVGGGVVINHRIYSGFNHAGCEVGHIVIMAGGEDCTCGRKGCFEAYASASALVRETEKAARNNPDSILNRLIAENGGHADGRTAFIGMREGDKAASEVVDFYIEMLAEGLGNVINGYMPEVIVIGGGVCNEGDALLIPVRERALKKAYLAPNVAIPRIELATMGNDAGIVGAAMMAMNCLEDGIEGK